jgi:dethiobiotin synthetase
MKKYFITGIGTGVGKTIVSAILTEALKADYWKPIQCGDLENTDSDLLRKLISNDKTRIHPEAYKFKTAASPHYAAASEKVKIDIAKIIVPETKNDLVIEGAGGLLVPLNEENLMIDLVKKLDAEVILVSQNYLGSINHTLLSVEALKSRNIRVKGIVFNGNSQLSSEEYILDHTGIKLLFSIPHLPEINKEIVRNIANNISNSF